MEAKSGRDKMQLNSSSSSQPNQVSHAQAGRSVEDSESGKALSTGQPQLIVNEPLNLSHQGPPARQHAFEARGEEIFPTDATTQRGKGKNSRHTRDAEPASGLDQGVSDSDGFLVPALPHKRQKVAGEMVQTRRAKAAAAAAAHSKASKENAPAPQATPKHQATSDNDQQRQQSAENCQSDSTLQQPSSGSSTISGDSPGSITPGRTFAGTDSRSETRTVPVGFLPADNGKTIDQSERHSDVLQKSPQHKGSAEPVFVENRTLTGPNPSLMATHPQNTPSSAQKRRPSSPLLQATNKFQSFARLPPRPIPEEYRRFLTGPNVTMQGCWLALSEASEARTMLYDYYFARTSDELITPRDLPECAVSVKNWQHSWECCKCQFKFPDATLYPINSGLSVNAVPACKLCEHERCGICLQYNMVMMEAAFSDGSTKRYAKREPIRPVATYPWW
ncbi:MAG: hypothetical protein Q9162_000643 [Coniocarpon cinnabarinum]